MRDICKGRYLQFTRPHFIPILSPSSSASSSSSSSPFYSSGITSDRTDSGSSSGGTASTGSRSGSNTSNLKYLANNNNHNTVENFQEFSSSTEFLNNNAEEFRQQHQQQNQQQQYSPLESRFCGKLEDYTESERTLTIPSSESTLLSSSTSLGPQDGLDNEIPTSVNDRMKISHNQMRQTKGIYLTVRLPVAVKARESFTFDLTALSPCQRVTLNGLDGQLQYSKHYENDQCSVVIHVPYGNTILTQIAVSSNSGIFQTSDDVGDNSNKNSNLKGNQVTNQEDQEESNSVRDVNVLTTAVNSEDSRSSHFDTWSTFQMRENSFSSGAPPHHDSNDNEDGRSNEVNGNTNDISEIGNVENLSFASVSSTTMTEDSSPVSDIRSEITIPVTGSSATSSASESHSSGIPQQQPRTHKNDNKQEKVHYENGDEEIPNNHIPISSSGYECPVSVRHMEEESNDINSQNSLGRDVDDRDDSNMKTTSVRRQSHPPQLQQQVQPRQKYLLIQAVDLVSGSEFNWCFDAAKQNLAHKRAWKSSGNRVSINFRMSHFDKFVLTYKSVKIPELAGDCERGWAKVDGTCVTLVEHPSKWTDAEGSCQLRGGHLVTVKNEQNENKLEKLIVER